MGTYNQPVDLPGIEIVPDEVRRTVTIKGKAATITFWEGGVVRFKGLGTSMLIDKVYPNGVTLINSDTSLPAFHTWKHLFSGNNIFNDAVRVTGWIEIR